MKQIFPRLGLLLGLLLLPAMALAQQYPATFPPNTVYGRLGIGAGPGQAIPFAALQNAGRFVGGPNSSVAGNIAAWGNTTGSSLTDSGVTFSALFANILNSQVSNYTIQATDCGKTILAGTGSTGFFTISIPSVLAFATQCVVNIANGDTSRWKGISGFNGCSSQNVIGPGQSCTIAVENGAWVAISRPGRYRPPSSTTINFFTDFTNGTDTFGATDGLSAGAAAFKSVEHCQLFVADQIDFNTASQTQVKCNMAANTADTQGMHSPVHALVGAQGGAAFQVVGASLAVSGAVSNAGACEISVSSTSTYSANEVVSVYSVGGATGCNGTWKATVTDSAHLTLQGTTFGGAYTSGGTVTNGSSFSTSGADDVDCYFGTVLQFSNVTFTSNQNGLGVKWGCKVYLLSGNIFGSSGGADIIINYGGSQVHLNGDVGISASATNAFVQIQQQGLLIEDIASNINLVPGVNPSFSGLAFVYADTQGQANFGGVTINTNGNTVTGTRFNANTGANITTGLQDGSLTYFPGNNAGSVGSGAVYDTVMNTSVAQGGTGSQTVSGARTNLGLTATGADTTYNYRANNLSDVANAATARTNLGAAASSAATTVAGSTCTLGSTCGLTSISNTLGADVAMNNTANYFTGPTIAQGTSGTWVALGTVTLDGTASDSIICKLWDGTTVMASSAYKQIAALGNPGPMSLSGILASPAANIRMDCRDVTSTAGVIHKSDGINNNASTLSAFRIN